MPKISTHRVKVNVSDLDEYYNITVNYNQENKFYAEVPDGFKEVCEVMTEKESKNISLQKEYRYKYQRGDYKFIICAEQEKAVVDKMKSAIAYFISQSIKKFPVIVINFENHSESIDRLNRWRGDPELHRVGLELHAYYCTELNSGGSKKYFKYFKDESDKDRQLRSEVHVDRESTVIPDTEQNRKFIEDLHAALIVLVEKMIDLTSEPKKLLEAISNNRKLLTNG